MNEIGHILDMALDPSSHRAAAERNAVLWSLAVRKRLYKYSENRPLVSGDDVTFNSWQETFLFTSPGEAPRA